MRKILILTIISVFAFASCDLFDSGGGGGGIKSESELDWTSGGGAVPQDDGLPDAYEATGMTYNGLNLFDDYGCTPGQIDLLLHIAPMHLEGGNEDPGMMLQKAALDKVVAAFASKGITLHIDVGSNGLYDGSAEIGGRDDTSYNYSGADHRVPFTNSINLSSSVSSAAAYVDTYFNNTSYFPAARKYAFYFMVFGSSQETDGSGGSSGIAWVNGRNFLITLKGWGFNFNAIPGLGLTSDDMKTYVANKQAATIMHEFGHNLGLLHGGNENLNYKPNYYSIMNYLYQMQGLPVIGNDEGDRYYYDRMFNSADSTEYSQWFWKIDHQFSVDAYNNNGVAFSTPIDFKNSPFSSSFKIDYSHGLGGPKQEANLDESTGLRQSGSGSVDWNGDGSIKDGIKENINPSEDTDYDAHYDYDDWHNLHYYYAHNTGGGSSRSTVDSELVVAREYDRPLNSLADLEILHED